MTNKEAISNLEQIYGIVSSDIQMSLDRAINALRACDEQVIMISENRFKEVFESKEKFKAFWNSLIDHVQLEAVNEKNSIIEDAWHVKEWCHGRSGCDDGCPFCVIVNDCATCRLDDVPYCWNMPKKEGDHED